jgi:hypothetical protein
MLTKNYDGILLFKLFKRLILDGLAASLFLVKFQFRHFVAVFNAHITFYKKFGHFIKKRKAEKKMKGSPITVGFYTKSIVFGHFLFSKKTFGDLDKKDFEA